MAHYLSLDEACTAFISGAKCGPLKLLIRPIKQKHAQHDALIKKNH